MRHYRINTHCSRCDLEAALLDDDIPLEGRVDVFELLKDLHNGVPNAIEAFDRIDGARYLYELQSADYDYEGVTATMWASIAYTGAFQGLLHVLPRFTGQQQETQNAIDESKVRFRLGTPHDEHDH